MRLRRTCAPLATAAEAEQRTSTLMQRLDVPPRLPTSRFCVLVLSQSFQKDKKNTSCVMPAIIEKRKRELGHLGACVYK